MGIKRLEIAGFKSIDSITLTDLPNYCVFAGANGAGKSNFLDALKFASTVINAGAVNAIRQFQGHEKIYRVQGGKNEEQPFHFACRIELPKARADYSLGIDRMNDDPALREQLSLDMQGSRQQFDRNGEKVTLNDQKQPDCSRWYSILTGYSSAKLLHDWLFNYTVFRIDPTCARKPDDNGAGPYYFDEYGRNLSTVFEKIQENKEDFETVMEWVTMIVPGLEKVHSRRNFDGWASMEFQENWTDYRFSPDMISDGTIYVLCLLATVLTRIKKPGVTMIEEPERGIHPLAIEQLSQFFREHANDEHQIFISTHNESFVRSAKAEELFFAVKEDGRTQFRLGRDAAFALEGMPHDTAWFQNMFDGGLPW